MSERSLSYKELFNKYASEYQKNYFDVSNYSNVLDVMLDKLHQDKPVILDIACGPANLSSYLRSRIPGAQIVGIDISDKMLELARQNILDGQFYCMPYNKMDSLEHDFDAIVCGFLLPYLNPSEKDLLFALVFENIPKGAFAFISTMVLDKYKARNRRSRDGKHEVIMHYHSGPSMIKELIEMGFRLIEKKELLAEDGDTELVLLMQKT